MTSAEKFKILGNTHFSNAEYNLASNNYISALKLLKIDYKSEDRPINVHELSNDDKNLLSALLKNQAACLIKFYDLGENGQNTQNNSDHLKHALTCCNKSLFYKPKDLKALYRRVQILEKLNLLDQAYNEALKISILFPNDKMVQKLCLKLRDLSMIKQVEEKSTEKRVGNMFEVIEKFRNKNSGSGDPNDLREQLKMRIEAFYFN